VWCRRDAGARQQRDVLAAADGRHDQLRQAPVVVGDAVSTR
jgi:hypothetical protein